MRNRALVDVAKDVLGKPYIYEEHYWPHDGDTRELTYAKTRKATIESLGMRPIRIGEKRDPAERVNAIRQLLPKCVFNNSPNVIEGLEALRSYRVDYDEKNATPRQKPKHDWSSHPTDAFGELAMQLRHGERSMRQPIAASDYDPMRIGQPDYMRHLTHEALEDDRRWTRQETAGISDYDPYKQ